MSKIVKNIHTNEGITPIDYESLANLPNIPAIVTSTVEQAGYMKKDDSSYARSSIQSEAFNADKEYSIGDYCIFKNVLYKFTEAKAAGEWDSAKVTSTTIDAELKAHTAAINEQNVNITKYKVYYFDSPESLTANTYMHGGIPLEILDGYTIDDIVSINVECTNAAWCRVTSSICRPNYIAISSYATSDCENPRYRITLGFRKVN